ncbi:MAG: flagellar biosynthesis anti-sigma factor FlgM, partial [Desulfatitalea sp.]|nr:flagellar biosynthesis anti-sigma factor FlgM [Desulfatitalea sp.]
IKARIESGTYRADPQKVAAKMLADTLQPRGE